MLLLSCVAGAILALAAVAACCLLHCDFSRLAVAVPFFCVRASLAAALVIHVSWSFPGAGRAAPRARARSFGRLLAVGK